MRRTLAAAALALAAAPPASAQEGVLHIYNWSDYMAPDTVARFEAETGIRVVYDVYDSNEMLEAKMLTGASGYDLVVPTSAFLQRQLAAGVYQPLDVAKLPNLANMDPVLMAQAAAYDPDNAHSVIYMWGTIGLGFDVEKVRERLGADAPTDSWSLIFDPANAAKLADCGISVLDSANEVLPSALAYLGLDPTTADEAALTQAAALLEAIRPHIRYFHSSQYISDLANGEICVALGYSGDMFIAADRAEAAGTGVEIDYAIPKEGAMQWFDLMAIPADAPNPDAAHAFIDFVMRPEIVADITNFVYFASANAPAMALIDPAIRDDPSIFPSAEVLAKLFPQVTRDARTDRTITRLWTRVRTGQ